MRILVTADWHFHPFKAFSRIGEDGVNSRLADIARAWGWCLEQAKNEGCEVMCVAGDLFHVRGQLKPSVVNVVLKCISDTVDRYGMPLVMVPGNHDMEDFRGGPTAVDVFGGMPRVYVLRDRTIEINGVKFLGIQYRQDVNEFLRVARELREEHDLQPGRSVVLCHQGLDDVAEAGMPATGLYANKLRDIFGADVPVFSGHYHNPWRRGEVVQVGAPIQHSFSSEGRRSGCWMYDTKKGSWHIANVFSPRFVTLTKGKIEAAWGEGDFIRIIAPDKKEADLAADFVLKRGAGGVTVQVVKDLAEYRSAGEAIGAEPTSVRSMVERYVSGQPDMEPYAARILALYDEVCA